MKSIEKSLNLTLSISLLVIFFIFWLISVFSLHHLMENYVITRLHHDNDAITKHLEFHSDNLNINLKNINSIYSRIFSGHYFVAKAPQRLLKSPSLNGYSLYLKPIKHNPEIYETLGPDNQTVLVLGYRTQLQGKDITLYVAEDHTPIQHMIHLFDIVIVILALISLMILYLIQRFLLQKGFHQLKPINNVLAALHKGKAVKLDPSDYPSEVSSLIDSLNQAVSSATTLLEKSRQSNANLAHSLKTPLNIIFQITDNPLLSDNPELHKTLSEQSQEILRLIERELKSARLASDMIPMTPFSLLKNSNGNSNSDLDDLITSFKQLYPNKVFDIRKPDKLALLPIEKEDGFELLGNLIDNACKYGHSSVNIDLSKDKYHFYIIIQDDGHGVPETALKQIQQRGFRLDETLPGHGIGLSIVKQIISAYRGNIQFSLSELGGLKISIQLNILENLNEYQ